jgi:hypothetical protein
MFASLTLKHEKLLGIPVWNIYDGDKMVVRHISHDRAEEWMQRVYDCEAQYATRRDAMARHPSGKNLGPRA